MYRLDVGHREELVELCWFSSGSTPNYSIGLSGRLDCGLV